MHVFVSNEQNELIFSLDPISDIVSAVLKEEKVRCDEVSIVFVAESVICELHEKYFNDPTVTDCITFPFDYDETEDYRLLGEVFVCPKTALNYSLKNNTECFEELTLYVVHGILHLCGYDDIEDEDRKKMREAEKHHMSLLKQSNLILAPR